MISAFVLTSDFTRCSFGKAGVGLSWQSDQAGYRPKSATASKKTRAGAGENSRLLGPWRGCQPGGTEGLETACFAYN
jgi:hypothetical protein